MLDYQRIVDDVRSSLSCSDSDGLDFLRAAAADYSVACDEVNERLHQCGTLLRQGLRSEAIQLSNIEPNLLEGVALLDFPEREEWAETARRCGLASPPAPLLEIAASLNETYAIDQPLATLLQQHRLLALARGSLSARIQILRRLAELDLDNPIWLEDLETFEKERQRQIRTEVETATRSGDAATLASLNAELSSPDWRNPPPEELVKAVAETQTRVHYWSVQSQLEQLAKELAVAESHFNAETARTLRDRWNRIIAESNFQPQPPVALQAASVFKWLKGEDEKQRHRHEYEAATNALAEAIDHERSASRLEDLYLSAARLDKIPAATEERYRATLSVLRRAALRRRLLQLAAIAAVGIILIATIGTIASYQRYERQVATTVSRCSAMIEHGQWEQAKALLSELAPDIKKDARIQEQIAAVEEAEKKDKTRLATFSQEVKAANYLLEQVRKSLAEKPGQVVLDRQRDELDTVQGNLERGAAKARTDEERTELAAAVEFASQVKKRWQELQDQAFLAACEDLDSRVTRLEGDKSAESAARQAKVHDCQADLQKWETDSSRVSPGLRSRVAALSDRLSALTKNWQEEEQQENDAREVTSAVGNIQNYVKALQAYIDRYPKAGRATDFRRVCEESLCWQAVADWNAVAEQLRQGGIVGLQPKVAGGQVSRVEALLDTFSGTAEGESLQQVLPYLKAIAARDSEGERIVDSLKKLFADPLMTKVWVVELGDGKRYYVPQRSKPDPDKSFIYAVNFDGKTKGKRLPDSEASNATVARAPQVAAAKEIIPILDGLGDTNWEDSFCRMIAVAHANQSMDPILKADILHELLTVGARGSHALEKAFGGHLEWFKKEGIRVQINWLDPDDREIADTRAETGDKLHDFPDIDKPVTAVRQDLASLRKCRFPLYRWIGWLHRATTDRWECLMGQTPDGSGRLLVASRPSPTGKPQLVEVGHFDHRAATIEAKAGSPLLEGRPIYLAAQ